MYDKVHFVTVQAHTADRHKHRPSALHEPLKWSVTDRSGDKHFETSIRLDVKVIGTRISETKTQKYSTLETVSIAEPLQNRQHAQNPYAVNSREKGKEGEVGKEEGRGEGRNGGRRDGGRKEGRKMEWERKRE